MRLEVHWVLLALAGTLGAASCGHVTFGSSQAAPAPPDWGYAYEPGYSQARYPYRDVAALNDAQTARYDELKRELSNILAVHTQVGSRDYSQVWANLDRERALALRPRYDPGQHLLEWRYENLGDTNLDGMVNTSDLLPIARLYDSLPGDLGFNPADTCGLGPVRNGLSGPAGYRDCSAALDSQAVMDARAWIGYGAQQVGLSYGRAVAYYRVLAGDGPDRLRCSRLRKCRCGRARPAGRRASPCTCRLVATATPVCCPWMRTSRCCAATWSTWRTPSAACSSGRRRSSSRQGGRDNRQASLRWRW